MPTDKRQTSALCPVCRQPDLPAAHAATCERAQAILAARALADEYAGWRRRRGLQPSRQFQARVGAFVVQVRAADFPSLPLISDEP